MRRPTGGVIDEMRGWVCLKMTQPPRLGYRWRSRAYGAVVARFVHTEEVTGSNPVTPTAETGDAPGVRPLPIASIRMAR